MWNSKDIYQDGKDIQSGWGLPIMGEPKTVITLQIGSNVITIDGKDKTIDTAPIIDKNSRTLVPIRAIAEALDCDVGWDGVNKIVTVIRSGGDKK